jgi:DNA topoisomerase-2
METSQNFSSAREKLAKKYKAIKPADIKNRLGLVVFLKDFENPQFNSQTKDELKNPMSDVAKHIDGKIDFEKFAKDILKNDAIISPIVDMFKLKEELKARQELKQAKKWELT